MARSSIGLPVSNSLAQAIHTTVLNIVVLINGRPLAEPWIVDNVSALVKPGAWRIRWYSARRNLLGHVNPSGNANCALFSRASEYLLQP